MDRARRERCGGLQKGRCDRAWIGDWLNKDLAAGATTVETRDAMPVFDPTVDVEHAAILKKGRSPDRKRPVLSMRQSLAGFEVIVDITNIWPPKSLSRHLASGVLNLTCSRIVMESTGSPVLPLRSVVRRSFPGRTIVRDLHQPPVRVPVRLASVPACVRRGFGRASDAQR
jgi:hypothetical protein